MIFENTNDLEQNLSDVVILHDDKIEVKNNSKLLEYGIDHLVYSAVLSEDAQTRHLSRVFIRKLADHLGIFSASIYPLYEAFGKGEVKGFTVPAMNTRTLVYDFARVVFEKAREKEVGAFIFEISRSEMKYTDQTQDELIVVILAAAIKSGWEGPVFLQGDHYQFNLEKYKEYPQGQIDDIQLAIKDALSAGFKNIDIDASTLVDLNLETLDQQQRENYEMTALMTKFIRGMQPSGTPVAIGGEIGHIGGKNSTVEDFEAFMKGYLEEVGDSDIISKVSVQTGTSHGGVPNPDGSLSDVNVDFEVLREIGDAARKYGLGGPVQHGASTLPNEMFDKFPEAGTVEIHLATGFQNIIFDTMPQTLREKLYSFTKENFEKEREEGWTDEQFVYKLRKKSLGPHKKDLWLISENDKNVIRQKLGEEISLLFEKLNLVGTRHTVAQYIGESPSEF